MQTRRQAYALLLLLTATTQPAWAEIDLRRDPEAAGDLALITACIDSATSWETSRACANITFKACTARIEGNVSHAHQGNCIARERDLWLHLFGLEALKVEAWTLLKDQQMRAAGDNRVRAHDAFLRFRTAPDHYRVAQCGMEVADIGAGNSKMTDEPFCQIKVIADGINRLRDLQSDMSVEMSS